MKQAIRTTIFTLLLAISVLACLTNSGMMPWEKRGTSQSPAVTIEPAKPEVEEPMVLKKARGWHDRAAANLAQFEQQRAELQARHGELHEKLTTALRDGRNPAMQSRLS